MTKPAGEADPPGQDSSARKKPSESAQQNSLRLVTARKLAKLLKPPQEQTRKKGLQTTRISIQFWKRPNGSLHWNPVVSTCLPSARKGPTPRTRQPQTRTRQNLQSVSHWKRRNPKKAPKKRKSQDATRPSKDKRSVRKCCRSQLWTPRPFSIRYTMRRTKVFQER